MRYEVLTIQPRGADEIITLCQKPNPFERLFGRHEEQVTAYGHGDTWWTMDGMEANRPLRRFLQQLCDQHSRPVEELPEKAALRDQRFDPIDEAGDESFPASDPPSWTRSNA